MSVEPAKTDTPRLTLFRVDGLFGLYNHKIPLNQVGRITAVIGPNGSGKTVSLKLIQSLFSLTFSQFYLTQFSSCEWHFSNGSQLRLTKIPAKREEGRPVRAREDLEFTLSHNDDTSVWTPGLQEMHYRRRAAEIERNIPFVSRIGPDLWRHDETGYTWGIVEFIEHFGEFSTDRERIRQEYLESAPEGIKHLIAAFQCRLIETQRLLATGSDQSSRRRGRMILTQDEYGIVTEQSTNVSVEQKSNAIKRTIGQILTRYANLSQSLDRVFPKRILSEVDEISLKQDEVSLRLEELDRRRQELEAAGILKTEIEPLMAVPRHVDTSLLRAISVYIEHTNSKLNVFAELLKKIQVFEGLVNQLFLDKSIKVNQAEGIVVTSRLGRAIPLRALSSGEQHQLVLIFALIFEAAANELILIDEPELSLHIGWQRVFVDHLKQIIEINPFDVVLATHSPTLLGKHYHELVVELGDVDDAQAD